MPDFPTRAFVNCRFKVLFFYFVIVYSLITLLHCGSKRIEISFMLC